MGRFTHSLSLPWFTVCQPFPSIQQLYFNLDYCRVFAIVFDVKCIAPPISLSSQISYCKQLTFYVFVCVLASITTQAYPMISFEYDAVNSTRN